MWIEYVGFTLYAIFWLILTLYLWKYYLPRAVETTMISRLLDRLQDPKDEEIQEIFKSTAVRMFAGITQNPELKKKLVGTLQFEMLNAVKAFFTNLENQGTKHQKAIMGAVSGGSIDPMAVVGKFVDKFIDSM